VIDLLLLTAERTLARVERLLGDVRVACWRRRVIRRALQAEALIPDPELTGRGRYDA
jgi:hypothetical protein